MLIKTSKKQKKEVLEIAMFVAVVQPLIVLPQAVHIFRSHSAADVSLITWGLLVVFNASNFVYGLVFGIKPLIIGNALWVMVDTLVVIGILMYK